MEHLKSILAAVDFSDCSKCALQQATRLAQRDGAALTVLHVIETRVMEDLEEMMPKGGDVRKGVLDGARKQVETFVAGAVQVEHAEGGEVRAARIPGGRIVLAVRDLAGVHGDRGDARRVLGSEVVDPFPAAREPDDPGAPGVGPVLDGGAVEGMQEERGVRIPMREG